MKLARSDKRVTDVLLLKYIQQQRIDPDGVEFTQDYAHRGLGKENSPYGKFYRNLNGREQWMVISGLPMVDCDGDPCTPGWLAQGASGRYVAKNNEYRGLIQGHDVELTVRNDDPFGRKKGATLYYSPRLFVSGVEVLPTAPVLMPIDPWNPNYAQNVLEWDYGVCKRKLRTVEGRVHGYWVFSANPGGDVLIRYGQAGDYRLKLGQYRQNDDEEFIPASVFASASYPFEVSDSATYYPDANPETTSVDGYAGYAVDNSTWATVHDNAGNISNDSAAQTSLVAYQGGTNLNTWADFRRGILLFDSSGLPDSATISAATLSLAGWSKTDGLSAAPSLNIYSSNPASNTGLVGADLTTLGSTAFSTAVSYAAFTTTEAYIDWVLNASGLAAISLIGVSKFGARDAVYDVPNSAPPYVQWAWSQFQIDYAEKGDGFKPKLVVTYTVPQPNKGIAVAMLSGRFI